MDALKWLIGNGTRKGAWTWILVLTLLINQDYHFGDGTFFNWGSGMSAPGKGSWFGTHRWMSTEWLEGSLEQSDIVSKLSLYSVERTTKDRFLNRQELLLELRSLPGAGSPVLWRGRRPGEQQIAGTRAHSACGWEMDFVKGTLAWS